MMRTKSRVGVGAISLLFALLSAEAQTTVTWERKAFGQTFICPVRGTQYSWPSNNNWSQSQKFGDPCSEGANVESEPSNWTTPNYPDGANIDVILGDGGAPGTNLDRIAVTLNSLTIQSVGSLNMQFGSGITANAFVFESDGVLTNAGGGGAHPFLTVPSGGTISKTGGAGSYTFPPNLFLTTTDATVSSLAGSLALSGNGSIHTNATFNASSGATIVLVPTGETALFSGDITGSGAGAIQHSAGRIEAAVGGTKFNFPGGLFQWKGGEIVALSSDRPFANDGTINLTGPVGIGGQFFSNNGSILQTGTLNIPFGAALTNTASGIYDLGSDHGITASGGGGATPPFNNMGLLRKSAGTGVSDLRADDNLLFNHLGGTVQVDSGTLRFGRGESNGGNFIVAAGAQVDVTGGSLSTNYAGTYTGSGAGSVELVSGQLNTSGDGATFNFPPNLFQWRGGVIAGASFRPFENAGAMTLAGDGGKQFSGVASNKGTIIQNGSGGLNLPFGSNFTNAAPGLVDLRTDAAVTSQGGGGSNPLFNNAGVLTKTAGTGTTAFDSFLYVTNTGRVEVLSGMLQFAQFVQTAGTTSLKGGNLTFLNEAVFDGGTLIGTGTITGSVRNNGASFAAGFSPGKITITGNYTQGADGVLEIEIGGSTPGTGYDQLEVGGTANLGGTLNVKLINGYRPQVGEVFTIVSPAALNGQFTQLNAQGFEVQANYAAGATTVTVTKVAPAITSATTASGTVGQPFTYQITASDEPTSFAASGLPAGLTVTEATGMISGTPSEAGTFNVTISASNSAGNGSAQLMLTIAPEGTPTPTPTATASPSPSPSPSPTVSPSPTASPTPSPTASPTTLLNISTRLRVGTGENALIGGFIITGAEAKRVIIRAIGPSLGAQGVNGALQDTTLELFDGAGEPLAFNDNWQDDQASEIEATTIPPGNDLESAIVRTLQPGNYTAVVRGKNNSTGIGLVEIYDVSSGGNTKLANISSRGFVETGENVLIGGFIVSGGGADTRVVLRAIGPSLANAGVEGVLQDPALELVDANGSVVRENDDWKQGQRADIEALSIQPANDRESALIAEVSGGNYTAVVRGSGDGIGVGLIEVYNVQ